MASHRDRNPIHLSARPAPDGLAIRLIEDPEQLDAAAWDALLARQAAPTPFLQSAYLLALHRSGSAVRGTGWAPCFMTVETGDGELAGGCALYLKSHSYGEYVFDWAWADAYRRHGLRYYPKLLGAVPFTPVPGTRLLARDDAVRALLAQAIVALARQQKLSSAHLLFMDGQDAAALERAGWMLRESVQFHWTQPAEAPWPSFEAFLQSLHRDKRKKIVQEQRRVAEAGVQFTVHEGAAISEALWDFFYRCYTLTYQAHGSMPYLERAFFHEMARTMTRHWLMFVARRDGAPVAASLVALDPERRRAYGRYWGSVEFVPCLHFDACYYQPLRWCIANGYLAFEGGAQGEHKMARGLLPVRTQSAHWLADPRFAGAVADFLAREGTGMQDYVDELRERNPFKRGEQPA
ncbi:GNAT family N-acetyltransferase [Azohydromonas caseinilytica]|uniref:N-acetyltransferase n=1 Tax=Azohydromonas caseinilytica TaxID=2728836 RepID=A0A848FF28_9BURK|nr:GNAT family N-acetyltransferase [Azohydromonas caseinilytica]NML16511.1 N-acetyltransferase [Azohydromonas caseinilytica]